MPPVYRPAASRALPAPPPVYQPFARSQAAQRVAAGTAPRAVLPGHSSRPTPIAPPVYRPFARKPTAGGESIQPLLVGGLVLGGLAAAAGTYAAYKYFWGGSSPSTTPTQFDKPTREHSTTEVGTFGIGPAGWVPLEQSHGAKTRYEWSTTPVPKRESQFRQNVQRPNTEQGKAVYKSKSALVDLLQANIKRHFEGQPLIPVYLAYRKTGDSTFIPDVSGTINKSTTFTTDHEIRMIYKLTEEMPDAEVKAIAKKTFFFQEQRVQETAHATTRTFETIPRPWDPLQQDYLSQSAAPTLLDPSQNHGVFDNYTAGGPAKWANRPRKRGESYANRATLPDWVNGLIAYKESCKLAVQ